MSINDVHEEMMANLSAAMDMGKFLNVFNTLIGVIRDQQDKITDLNAKSEAMAALIEENAKKEPVVVEAPPPVAAASNELVESLVEKIDALENKLNDTLQELHGFGEDKSILDREDSAAEFISMSNSFKEPSAPRSARFINSIPSIDEADGAEEGSAKAASRAASRAASAAQSREGSAGSSRQASRAASRNPSRRSSGRKSPLDGGDGADGEEEEGEGGEAEGEGDEGEEEVLPDGTVVRSARNSARNSGRSSGRSSGRNSINKPTSNDELDSFNAGVDNQLSDNTPPDSPTSPASPTTTSNTAANRKTVTIDDNSRPGSRPASRGDTNTSGGINTDSSSRPGSRGSPVMFHLDGVGSTTNSTDVDDNTDPTKLAPHALAKQTQAKLSTKTSTAALLPKGLLQVTPLEMRPSTMQHSFSTKMNETNFLFPNMNDKITPKSAAVSKALWKASITAGMDVNIQAQYPHLHRRIIPHYHKYHLDSKLSHERLKQLAEYKEIRSHDHKERMEAGNLKYLTYEKRMRLCKMLRQKGRFIQIGRNMLEESRTKYAARSLKQNVEFVEAETRRLFNKVKNLQGVVKKQHAALRYVLPMDFHETFDRLVDFLEHLEVKGGVEEIMALPRSDSIVCYDEHGNLPKSIIDVITAKLRPIILQELSGLKSQVTTLKDEAITYSTLSEMLTPDDPTSRNNNTTTTTSTSVSKERDLTRRRMISMIKDTIYEDRKVYEEEKRIAEEETRNRATVAALIHHTERRGSGSEPATTTPVRKILPEVSVSHINTNTNTNTTSTANAADKAYIDDQVALLSTSLETLQSHFTSSKDAHTTELALLQSKLEMLEHANSVIMERDGEIKEQRKKDAEQLKIMQKRLASVSVDNVLDELKVLQLQVNDRPSTTDVSNMMEGISHTFRKHLGENVIGLRGLVDQVYRQIHHKVNREDIRRLISAKLSVMEADILRREQEMFTTASSTRCMSCGQLPPDPTNAFVGHTAARKQGSGGGSVSGGGKGSVSSVVGGVGSVVGGSVGGSVSIPTGYLKGRPTTSPNVIIGSTTVPTDVHHNTEPSSSNILFNPPYEGSSIHHTMTHSTLSHSVPLNEMDDEISLHSEHNNTAATANTNTTNPRAEEVYNVITGSAGLKSLMPQHTPMQPIRDPYHTHTKPKNTIPEPLYRKAKMAAHIKEMVKVSQPAAQGYGYNANNPFFVVEGYADDDSLNNSFNNNLDSGSMYSTASKQGRRPKTQGYNNNSSTSPVYVAVPKNTNMLLSASTNALGDYNGSMLPQINAKM